MELGLFKVERLRDGLICFAVFLLAKWLLGSKTRKSKLPLPPSPPGLPLIGHLPMFRRDFRKVFRGLKEKYGSVFSIRVGPQRTVVMSEIDAVKEAFVNQAEAFSDRHMPPLLKQGLGSAGSFAFDNGPVWKARRRFGLSAMRTFGVGKYSMEQRIIEEAKMLCETIENNQETSFNPKGLITHSVSSIICGITFGQRFDLNDPEFNDLISRIHSALSSISFFTVGQLFPFLLYTPLYSKFRNLISSLKTLVTRMVDEHGKTLDDQHIRDIIDLYILEIREQKKRGDEIVFDETRVWRGIFDLFAAGTGTTSTTLLWGILLMAAHPDAMEQVQNEIDCVIGDHRPPSMSDREALPLTMATIMEVQRFRPVSPLGFPRFTNKDAEVKGYSIPKGTAAIVNIWELMHSTKYWEEPDKFKPSRFMSDDGRSIIKPDAFIPFGIGSRVCLGEILAKMEVFLTFTCLLQRFIFRLPGDSPANIDAIPGVALIPYDFLIKAEKRV
ncbi:cytochrome P450 2U1 [Strongylocentrotus purpuratus]|uniref:Cytochrome P450 n=1 Tax=Strongylocentrotus purpuratus TaxID=7668 RepID=A0A7M7RDL8_STRPU|nr:cytochrome P450 2U1 [Strongylocentrotus purpuratus]